MSACATQPQQPVVEHCLPTISYDAAVAANWPMPHMAHIPEHMLEASFIETDDIAVNVPQRSRYASLIEWQEAVSKHIASLQHLPEDVRDATIKIAEDYAYADRNYNDGFIKAPFAFLCYWPKDKNGVNDIHCTHWEISSYAEAPEPPEEADSSMTENKE